MLSIFTVPLAQHNLRWESTSTYFVAKGLSDLCLSQLRVPLRFLQAFKLCSTTSFSAPSGRRSLACLKSAMVAAMKPKAFFIASNAPTSTLSIPPLVRWPHAPGQALISRSYRLTRHGGSRRGPSEAVGQHDFLSWKGSGRTIAWMVRIPLPHLLIYRKRKGKALDRLGNRGEATNGETQEPERRSDIGRRL